MKEYKVIEIPIGITMKSTLQERLDKYAKTGWIYKNSVQNEAMGTIAIILEKEF
jgi:hypothetical protein